MIFFIKIRLLKYFLFLNTLFIILISCNEQNKVADINIEPSLKNGFKKEFLIGSAVNDNLILGKDSIGEQLVKREYTTITPENSLKKGFLISKWQISMLISALKMICYS